MNEAMTPNLNNAFTDLVAQVRRTLPFSRFSDAQVARLLEGRAVVDAAAGATLLAAAEAARDYFVLLHGEAEELWPHDPAHRARHFSAHAGEPPTVISAVARGVAVVARAAVRYVRVDGNDLDALMATLGFRHEDAEFQQRLQLFAQTTAFRRLPLENVAAAVRRMQLKEVAAGDTVFRQGEKGDLYYIVESGRAEVWRTDAFTDETWLAATLRAGDVFGEEALLMGGFRTGTVKMLTAGRLWTLTSDDFVELVEPNLVLQIEPALARQRIAAGSAHWIDCRYEMEYEEFHLPNAQWLPLETLRQRIGELNPKLTYIVYCRSGRRSRCAAYLLRERNIDAYSLVGGIRDWQDGAGA